LDDEKYAEIDAISAACFIAAPSVCVSGSYANTPWKVNR